MPRFLKTSSTGVPSSAFSTKRDLLPRIPALLQVMTPFHQGENHAEILLLNGAVLQGRVNKSYMAASGLHALWPAILWLRGGVLSSLPVVQTYANQVLRVSGACEQRRESALINVRDTPC